MQLTGLDEPVREFVLAQPVTERFLSFLHDFFAFAIPAYQAEGKTRVTDGHRLHRRRPSLGRHRGGSSPTDLRAQELGPVRVWHRELERR